MVGSFIVLLIAGLIRITAGTLTSKFSWLSKILPFLNYCVYGALALFVLFVVIKLFKAIFGGGGRRNRKDRN